MSDPIGTYTFLPWMRHGVANTINGTVSSGRATIDVPLELEGQLIDGGVQTMPVGRTVQLYGPGDIIGIDRAQISRVEPEHWVTNFEPNYLVAIEFYDEDFPWRYTPAQPDNRKLQPWLALVVLEEETEFREAVNIANRPLPLIEITSDFDSVFPNASESWAWAHAHFNGEFSDLVIEDDADKVAQAAQKLIDTIPDRACSRLLCPRKLKPKTSYHAFLIPAFESGRLAGLGYQPESVFQEDENALEATSSAWGEYGVPANRPDSNFFPFYHRWYFRTAERGDFESLVRLLQPKIVDSRVGHRDMDVSDPAPNISGITDPELNGVLRLGGALKAPLKTLTKMERDDFNQFDQWADPYPQQFQTELAAFVNLSDSYQHTGTQANTDPVLDNAVNNEGDPLITPPIYGRWHALTERLLHERDGNDVNHRENWLHDLNLDPRWRVAAGFGTKVIQQNQESYMEAAWDQIGDIIEANRRIRFAQLAKVASRQLHQKHLASIGAATAGKMLMLTAPMQSRIIAGDVTVRSRSLNSPLNLTMTSTALRRAIRPGGRVARRLKINRTETTEALVSRTNAGEISAAPPKVAPEELFTPDDLSAALQPQSEIDGIWAQIGGFLRQHAFVAISILLALIVFVLLLLGPGIISVGFVAAMIAATYLAWQRAKQATARQAAAESVREDNMRPGTVDALPNSANFDLLTELDLLSDLPDNSSSLGGGDNAEAIRFKSSLKDQYQLLEISARLGEVPQTTPMAMKQVATDIVAEIHPDKTVPHWTFNALRLPAHIHEQLIGGFVEVMAYPEFDIAMYDPLAKAGDDLFVPNLHLVEPNSVTLLETNQEFIEAYMVGLNHEFSRELLWREFPTDQRGSYFRQFWDVRKKIAEADDKETAREQFKDIKELHRWPAANDLGDNDNREQGTEAEEELVLVIRGELLKKYPNTIITAQKAAWQRTDDEIDKTLERELDASDTPLKPLYEARVAPDIYFFGFDITAIEARGDDTVDDKPGYFFRIEEVPGDARFGFDIKREPDSEINVWNDLAWDDVAPGFTDGIQIKVVDIPQHNLVDPSDDSLLSEKIDQYNSDKQVQLDAELSSAELAYIALQTPVIMAIHASELLPDQEDNDE